MQQEIEFKSEIWVDIEGYEGRYKVSNKGNVKSLPKSIGNHFRYSEIILKLTPYKEIDSYLFVTLYTNKKPKPFLVHRLVATAFIPNPDNKPQVNHINGTKDDNIVENLEWCTASENKIHSYEKLNLIHSARGNIHYNTKLTNEDVLNIRNLYASKKYLLLDLSLKYNICQAAIHNIIKRKSWKHI